MDITRLAGFEDQPHFGPRAFADQVLMDRGDTEQARNRRPLFIDAAVTEDQELVPILDRLGGLLAHGVDSGAETIRPFGDTE